MTNTQLLILALVLVAIYLYWKKQVQLKPTAEEPEIFWDASDSEEETEPLTKELAAEQKDWFSEKHWLSDQEIDWALTQILTELPEEKKTNYKILEATQFMFTKESMATKDPDARFSFPVLLSELTGFKGDLVFIPVNNPNFHWSLLVYEVKEKKFYHFDTLRGANDTYVKPLLAELLKFLLESWQDSKFHVETRYHLKQGNTWDCGIAVIELVKAIVKDYPTFKKVLLYTKLDFNFPTARLAWKNKLTHDQN